ncbi:ROK family transcriptional regulator [Neoasaia chiangmaiensis]|uniref:ROK family transcriptional regulator n=1 Tax=Neoasaia chiangmaiensis TaxID=320497 RepID=UPI0011BECEE8|nr:ROK family transcriptional regulator [Neoasaia chiangmaiensis]
MKDASSLEGLPRRVVAMIAQHGEMTRADIATKLGISKGRVSVITTHLLDQRIIEHHASISGVRRPSALLRLSPSAATFIGISLHCRPFIAVATDPNGNIIFQNTFYSDSDPDSCIESICDAVAVLRKNCSISARFLAVGLSLPGYISADKQTCITSTVLGWENAEIGHEIARVVGLPVYLENDTNALATYEAMFGSMRRVPAFAIVAVGDGIGTAYTMNHTVYRGENGGAGELAHLPIAPGLFDGVPRPCRCGNRGCLETIASSRGISSRAEEEGLPQDLGRLSNLAREGNEKALHILHTAAAALSFSMSNLIQILDPSHLIVILPEELLPGVFATALRQTFEQNLMPGFKRANLLILQRHNNLHWAVGAACVAARSVLLSPHP